MSELRIDDGLGASFSRSGDALKNDGTTASGNVARFEVISGETGLTVETSADNLFSAPLVPVEETLTLVPGDDYALSYYPSSGSVMIEQVISDTLTADFATGTHTGTVASGDSLKLTGIADPTFTRASVAYNDDGTTVTSGQVRYVREVPSIVIDTKAELDSGTFSVLTGTGAVLSLEHLRPSFTRANSGTIDGTVYGINSPRYVSGGILMEEQSTNAFIYSCPTATGQITSFSSNITLASDSTFGSGFTHSIRIVDDAVLSYAVISKSGTTFTNGQTWTLSAYIQMDDGLAPNPGTSASLGDFAIFIGNSPATTVGYTHVSGGIYRVYGTRTVTSDNSSNGIYKYAAQSSREFKITGLQLELESYATTYIPTNGASVTRMQDALSISSDAISPTAGAIIFKAILPAAFTGTPPFTSVGNNGYIFDCYTGSYGRIIANMIAGSASPWRFYVNDDSGTQVTISGTGSIATGAITFGYRWNGTEGSIWYNGTKVGSSNSVSVPTVIADNINIGGRYSGNYNSNTIFDRASFYNTAPSDAEMAYFTSAAPTGAVYEINFTDNLYFNASGVYTSKWFNTDTVDCTFDSLTLSSTVPSGCTVSTEYRYANESDYSDASSWTENLAEVTGRFIQYKHTLVSSESNSSLPSVTSTTITPTNTGSAYLTEPATTNLLTAPTVPAVQEVTVTASGNYNLSFYGTDNASGSVLIEHKKEETTTADFSTGTLSNTTASSNQLALSTPKADPNFTRATSATKYDGTTVASGAARYEDVIQQLLLTNNRDWNNGTLERVNSTPDGKLGVFITDDFDTVTSGFYTAATVSGTLTPTFNTASSRLELLTTYVGSMGTYIYSNYSAKNTAVEAVFSQSFSAGLIARWTDVNNYYLAWVQDNSVSASNNIRFYKVAAGVVTALGSAVTATFTRGTQYKFRFEIVDSILKLYQNDVLITSLADTSITAAGKVGFYTNSSSTATYIHSFKIDDKTPLFGRNSVAFNPQTGASVAANVPRYVNGKNLLTKNQSDVETNAAGFSNWAGSTSFSRYTTSAYAGSACLQVISDPATANSGVYAWSDRMPGLVPAGSTLTASVYLVGNSGTVQINCAIEYTDGTVTNNLGGTITVTPTWTRYSRSTAATAGKTISRVQIAVVTTAAQTMTWYMDNLQVEVGATATTWQQGGGNAILIEEGTLNLLPANTDNPDNWQDYLSSVNTFTSGQVDPFGGTSAYRVQTSGGTSIIKLYHNTLGTATNGTKYSGQCWVKNNSATTLTWRHGSAGGNGNTVTVVQADGWKLCKSENWTGQGVAHQMYFYAPTSGDVLDFYMMWPQAEAKSYCTSYITPAVTRASDQLSLPIFPTSSVSEGSIVFRAYFGTDVITGTSANTHNLFFAYNDGSPYDYIRIVRAGTYLSARVADSLGGSTDANWATVSISEGWHSVGMRWNGTKTSLYFDGTEVASDTTSVVVPLSIPTVSVGIGHGSTSQQWNHAIDDINFFSRYLSDAEIAAATTNS